MLSTLKSCSKFLKSTFFPLLPWLAKRPKQKNACSKIWPIDQLQGDPKESERFFKNGCGIQMSQATPTKFSMLLKHNYGQLFLKFGDHSFKFSFVHGPSWLRVLESIHRYGVIFTFWKKSSKDHCEAMLDVKKIYFIDFQRYLHEFFTEIEIFYLRSPSDL